MRSQKLSANATSISGPYAVVNAEGVAAMTVDTRPAAPPAPSRRRRLRWLFPALGLILWLIVGGPLASLAGKTSDVQKNDNASYLPESAESTAVLNLDKRFVGQETAPGIIVFTRAGGLTDADKST